MTGRPSPRRSPSTPAVGEGRRGAKGHIGYLLRQAQAGARLAMDGALADAGLTSPQFLVLNLLDAYPGASGADIARTAMLTPQTMHAIVRNLERDGLLERCPHAAHGRVLQLHLSDEGRARLRECKRRADAVERRLLAMVPAGAEPALRVWLVAVAQAFAR